MKFVKGSQELNPVPSDEVLSYKDLMEIYQDFDDELNMAPVTGEDPTNKVSQLL